MKKIFTLFAVAMMAIGANAQETILFSNDGTYANGATLASDNVTVVLGNDRATKNYDLKLASVKAYCAGLFGQTVPVQNADTGEMENKTRVVYVVGGNNPKDGPLDDSDKPTGASYSPDKANTPQAGCYFMITPKKAGHLVNFIVLNASKNIYVVKGSDGTCLPISDFVIKKDADEPETVNVNEDYTVDEKTTGTIEFDVVANETYYVFCNGSKLSFGGCVFTAEGGEVNPGDYTETTLWEGSLMVNGWADQPFLLSDGGTELQAVNAKAGDILRFYMSAPDNNWEVELTEGHWGGMYVRWAEYDHGGTNEDGTPREYTVVDLTNVGYAEFTLTEEVLQKAFTVGYWGGTFLLNGDGNLNVTKLTILQQGGGQQGTEGEKVNLIDKFVSNWNGEETNTHNADGTVTYNGKQWGGLSAWLCDENGNPTDWSMYTKLVFEFAEATPAACQGFVQCLGDAGDDVNNTWWGNAGITKLECPFEGKDMTKVKQACLQAAEDATYQISAIYLVADVTGVQETVMVPNKMINNGAIYNLAGQKVGKDYKGIVIQNGRKFIQK